MSSRLSQRKARRRAWQGWFLICVLAGYVWMSIGLARLSTFANDDGGFGQNGKPKTESATVGNNVPTSKMDLPGFGRIEKNNPTPLSKRADFKGMGSTLRNMNLNLQPVPERPDSKSLVSNMALTPPENKTARRAGREMPIFDVNRRQHRDSGLELSGDVESRRFQKFDEDCPLHVNEPDTSRVEMVHTNGQEEFLLTIAVSANASDGNGSLRRLLSSLLQADYKSKPKNVSISLDVFLEDAATHNQTTNFLNSIHWPHGRKTLHAQASSTGLIPAVIETWRPSSDNEIRLILDANMEVSPLYHEWIQNAAKVASPHHDPRIMGISLHTPRVNEVSQKAMQQKIDFSSLMKEIAGDATSPYFQQLPPGFGAVFYAKHWREYIQYMQKRVQMMKEKKEDIKIPNAVLSGRKSNWEKFMIEIMHIKGWYMLYPSFPGQLSFSINHMENGKTVKQNDTNHLQEGYSRRLLQQTDLPILQNVSHGRYPLAVPLLSKLPVLDTVGNPFASKRYLEGLQSDQGYNYTIWSYKEEKAVKYTVSSRNGSEPSDLFHHNQHEQVCKDYQPCSNRLFQETGMATLLLSTFDRMDVLELQLEYYTRSPRIASIIVTWNSQTREPPPTMQVNGKIVDFYAQTTDSLNNRFLPSMKIITNAVIIMDDDMKVALDDIELLFETWTVNQNKVVGFLPRLSRNGTYVMQDPHRWNEPYKFILTKVMILDKRFLQSYSCSDAMKEIRSYVSKAMNCEDIAINQWVSFQTKEPAALYVSPLHFIGDFGDSLLYFYGCNRTKATKSALHLSGSHSLVRSHCSIKFEKILDELDPQGEKGQTKLQNRMVVTTMHGGSKPIDPDILEILLKKGASANSRFVELSEVTLPFGKQKRVSNLTVAPCVCDDRGGVFSGAAKFHFFNNSLSWTTSPPEVKHRASRPELGCRFGTAEVELETFRKHPLYFYWKHDVSGESVSS